MLGLRVIFTWWIDMVVDEFTMLLIQNMSTSLILSRRWRSGTHMTVKCCNWTSVAIVAPVEVIRWGNTRKWKVVRRIKKKMNRWKRKRAIGISHSNVEKMKSESHEKVPLDNKQDSRSSIVTRYPIVNEWSFSLWTQSHHRKTGNAQPFQFCKSSTTTLFIKSERFIAFGSIPPIAWSTFPELIATRWLRMSRECRIMPLRSLPPLNTIYYSKKERN